MSSFISSLRLSMKASEKETLQYCLVYWLEEDTVTTVYRDEVMEPQILWSKECHARPGDWEKTYKEGIIAGMGTKKAMAKLEDDFVAGDIQFDIQNIARKKRKPLADVNGQDMQVKRGKTSVQTMTVRRFC